MLKSTADKKASAIYRTILGQEGSALLDSILGPLALVVESGSTMHSSMEGLLSLRSSNSSPWLPRSGPAPTSPRRLPPKSGSASTFWSPLALVSMLRGRRRISYGQFTTISLGGSLKRLTPVSSRRSMTLQSLQACPISQFLAQRFFQPYSLPTRCLVSTRLPTER